MRNCPVCASNKRFLIMEQKFTIPDQWKIPNNLSLYSCSNCSTAYLDADKASQNLYDDYYRSGQFNFVAQNDLESKERLEALGLQIQTLCSRNARILDIGGEDGQLQNILINHGFTRVEFCGPNMDVQGYFDLLVMSHLVEHIYDMDGFF